MIGPHLTGGIDMHEGHKIRWYEANSDRFRSESRQLTAQGFHVSITDEGRGAVAGYLGTPDSTEIAVLFPPAYPSEPPRIYVSEGPGNGQISRHADGAIDLEAIEFRWNPQRRAEEAVRAVLRFTPPDTEGGDLEGHRLTLRNLTDYAKGRGDPGLGGREKELTMMQELLIRQENAGLVLLGKAGVGKTSLVMQLAHLCASGRVPPVLSSMNIYELRLEDIAASTRQMGDAEREIGRLRGRAGRLILFVDEIHRMGSPDLAPLADAIKPEMATGTFRVIGATTDREWRQIKDEAFKRRLTPIYVEEPSPQQTHRLIQCRLPTLQRHYGIEFPDDAVRAAIAMAHIYLPDRAFPSKAMDILDRAAAAQIVSGVTPPKDQEESHAG